MNDPMMEQLSKVLWPEAISRSVAFKFLNLFVQCHVNLVVILANFSVKLIGKLDDGTIFTKKGHEEEPFEFKVDEGTTALL